MIGHCLLVAAENHRSVEELAEQVRTALESADMSLFGDLLDPNVRWGAPDDPTPSCQTRSDVLAWYDRGRAAGRRAHVVGVETHCEQNLVHLRVVEPAPAGRPNAERDRWQVLTCSRGRVIDIRGFETHDEAVSRLASST